MMADLDAVPSNDPAYAQAQLTGASVLRVQGRYAEAAIACAQLVGRSDDFVATLCELSLQGLQGKLGAALSGLAALQEFAATRPPDLRAWHAAEWAEARQRAGDAAGAETLYRAGLGQYDDHALRAAYADLLLAQGRAAEAERLLREHARVDAQALRLLQAQHALGRADPALRARVSESYAAARRRGEQPHLREEATYALHIEGDAARALNLARQNWAEQREPADTLLLAAAARAAGQLHALVQLREWLRATGYKDARLVPLIGTAP